MGYIKYNMQDVTSQHKCDINCTEEVILEVLHDVSETGKQRPWSVKKMRNMMLANVYDDINNSKAARLRQCANYLTYRMDESGKLKLDSMDSCRVRLCPMCSWRRSLKTYSNVSKIMDAIESEKQYSYISLTLTIRNVVGNDLCVAIDNILKGWHILCKQKRVKRVVQGWYRGLEITHNLKKGSEWYDTYHPHIHVLLAVNKSYYVSRDYISQAEWIQLWQQSANLSYTPSVFVSKVKGNNAKAVAEVAKYAVKDNDYVIQDDYNLSVDTVRILDKAIDKRRLLSYGGLMRVKHKLLNLDDDVSGDLIHIDDDNADAINNYKLVTYFWQTGYNQYVRPI